MKKILLSYEQTGYTSKAVIDYLNEAPALKPFYVLPPKLNSFPFMMELKKKDFRYREEISQSLMQQHSRLFAEKFLDSFVKILNH